jgi:hypothetical protein
MHAALTTQAFTPHTAETAKMIAVSTIAAIVVFGRRLLYLVAYGMVILFLATAVAGIVVLAQLMHGLSPTSTTGAYLETTVIAASTQAPANASPIRCDGDQSQDPLLGGNSGTGESYVIELFQTYDSPTSHRTEKNVNPFLFRVARLATWNRSCG